MLTAFQRYRYTRKNNFHERNYMVYEIFGILLAINLGFYLLYRWGFKHSALLQFWALSLLTNFAYAIICIAGFTMSTSMDDTSYGRAITQKEPTFKGKLLCSDNNYTVVGTQEVKFNWKNAVYRLNYDVNFEVPAHLSRGSSCYLGRKPLVDSVVFLLQKDKTSLSNLIMNSLSQGYLSSSRDFSQNPHAKVANQVLRALIPQSEQPVEYVLTPSRTTIQEANPTLKRVKVPELAAVPAENSDAIKDMLNNISAQ